jgi:hypothetical protein
VSDVALLLVADDFHRLTLLRVRPWHRLLAKWRAASLDRTLADGADPEQNVYLAARAMQLTGARTRRHLADGLRRVLAEADRSPGAAVPPRVPPGGPAREAPRGPARVPAWPTRVPVRRASVATGAAELGALCDHLLAPGPLPARGVAMVRQLLSDGAGPLYRGPDPAALTDAARRAAAALAR